MEIIFPRASQVVGGDGVNFTNAALIIYNHSGIITYQ